MDSDSVVVPFAPCAKCGHGVAKPVKFSWWGGVLGPRLLNHVKCEACGHKFNGKSGKDNTAGIAIYCVVVGGAAFILMIIAFFFLARL